MHLAEISALRPNFAQRRYHLSYDVIDRMWRLHDRDHDDLVICTSHDYAAAMLALTMLRAFGMETA